MNALFALRARGLTLRAKCARGVWIISAKRGDVTVTTSTSTRGISFALVSLTEKLAEIK